MAVNWAAGWGNKLHARSAGHRLNRVAAPDRESQGYVVQVRVQFATTLCGLCIGYTSFGARSQFKTDFRSVPTFGKGKTSLASLPVKLVINLKVTTDLEYALSIIRWNAQALYDREMLWLIRSKEGSDKGIRNSYACCQIEEQLTQLARYCDLR